MYDPFCTSYNISLNVLFYVCVEILACDNNKDTDLASSDCTDCRPYCWDVYVTGVYDCHDIAGMLKLIMRSSLLAH